MVNGAVAVEELSMDDVDYVDGEQSHDSVPSCATPIAPEICKMIESKLLEWIDNKGYLAVGVSIIEMSSTMCTNRTYLSRYINMTYGVSFREWVLSLRIEEAKRLMLEDDERQQISQVAHSVGFTSPASFTRAFTRHEGVAPMRWREMNGGR